MAQLSRVPVQDTPESIVQVQNAPPESTVQVGPIAEATDATTYVDDEDEDDADAAGAGQERWRVWGAAAGAWLQKRVKGDAPTPDGEMKASGAEQPAKTANADGAAPAPVLERWKSWLTGTPQEQQTNAAEQSHKGMCICGH